ncbi:hemoglobin [Sphingomonas palmae]|uniref:Hemoglobin n=1 Tax=Sphingomonas palmae TaxID=1855283 RepID=A0A1H7T6G8_9SPHN|nr:group III truncated hemoglobin [Sphingomonas palmae]SEL80383.1 hemoglobin [Sphingomonas palmae]
MTDAAEPVAAQESLLRTVVAAFYRRVRADPLLGPVFEQVVEDWSAHQERLTAFWSAAVFKSGRYKGRPVPAHMAHGSLLTRPMFDRWLEIWAEVTSRMAPELAPTLQFKAVRIAESIQLALFFEAELHAGANGRRPTRLMSAPSGK